MKEPLRIEPGDSEADELIRILDGGRRVTIEVEVLGSVHEVTLRRDGSTYYCETPMRLYRTDDPQKMRARVRDLGYVRGPADA